MDDRLLLFVALFTGLAGLAVLFFLPDLPSQSVTGEVVWVDGSRGLVVVDDARWVTLLDGELPLGSCVEVSGVVQGDQVLNARVLQAFPVGRRRCS